LDALAQFAIDLADGCDVAGLRVMRVAKVPWNEDFQLRCLDSEEGRKGYQYGLTLTTRV